MLEWGESGGQQQTLYLTAEKVNFYGPRGGKYLTGMNVKVVQVQFSTLS